VFITQRQEGTIPGVRKILYRPKRTVTPQVHHYLPEAEVAVLNAQEVARVALDLRNSGFTPDVMLGHNGWGRSGYLLRDIFPHTPLMRSLPAILARRPADFPRPCLLDVPLRTLLVDARSLVGQLSHRRFSNASGTWFHGPKS
jgi:hypothetical protein